MTFNRDAFVLVQHVTRSWGGQEQDRGGEFCSVTRVEDEQEEESDSWPKIERFRTDFVFKRLLRGRLFRTKICRIFFFFKSLFYFFLEKIYDSCGEFFLRALFRERESRSERFFLWIPFFWRKRHNVLLSRKFVE